MHLSFSPVFPRLFSTRLLKICFLLFFLLVSAFPPHVRAEKKGSTETVTAIGTAPYEKNNRAGAKKAAIANAVSVGVNQVAASLFSPALLSKKLKNYTSIVSENPNAFVDRYKLLAESSSKNRYYVVIEAQVASDRLTSKLSGITSVTSGSNKKSSTVKVLFLLSEQDLQQQSPQFWWGEETTPVDAFSESGMAQKMKNAGFQIIAHGYQSPAIPVQAAIIFQPDLTNRDALDIGKFMKADVVIVGKAVVYEVAENGGSKHAYNATLTARAIRVKTGNEIGSVFETVVQQDIDGPEGSRQALKMSGMNGAAKLIPKLSKIQAEKASSSGRITLKVSGTKNLGNFIRFRRELRSADGVRGIQIQGIQPDESVVYVKTDKDIKALTAALKAMKFELFSVKIIDAGGDSIRIALIAK